MIYWFTGQPGSGKSTLARALKDELHRRGHTAVHLDGEELREMTGNRDFSRTGRITNIRMAQKLAAKLNAEGIFVIVSLVSPYRALREEFKQSHPVVEIHTHTSTVRGKEHFFVEYEPPMEDFIDLDTDAATVEQCILRICEARPPRLP